MNKRKKRVRNRILAIILALVMAFQLGFAPISNTYAMEITDSTEQETEASTETTVEEEQANSEENTSEQATNQDTTEEKEIIPETEIVLDEDFISLDNKDFETQFNIKNQWENQFEAEIIITNTLHI